MSSKKELSERDICTKYIAPALGKAGWDIDIKNPHKEEIEYAYLSSKLLEKLKSELS